MTDELGFYGAINYKTQNIKDELSKHCPKGIDVYFDNVGETISDQVIKQVFPFICYQVQYSLVCSILITENFI